MNRARLLLLFLLALSLTPAHAQVPADLQFAATLGEELFQNSGATGMVLVIVRDREVFFHGYGETAPGSHALPTQDSVVRLCSLTKIFTTDVLAKLAADKTIRLTDPLQRYVPAHTLVPRRIQSITLEDLATHTSGLPRELTPVPHGTPHFTFPDYATRWRWLPKQQLKSTPGTVALYSNVAFDLLSDALASATHEQYAALLAERTLNPLHMRNTTYFPNAVQCSRLLQGAHGRFGQDQGPCTSTEQTAGSSGLYSTASDMAIWLQYLLNDPATAQQPSPQAIYLEPSNLIRQQGLDHAGAPTGIGLGWIHILPSDSPSHIIEKTGGGAGFETYIALNHPHHTAIFAAITDGPGRPTPAVGGAPTAEPPTPHIGLFYGANNLLAAVAGLPPLPPPPPPPVRKTRTAPTRKHTHVRIRHRR